MSTVSNEVPEQERVKVAIIGGGCAAATTAFELSRPEHRGKYEVTVYQLGWRMGGKGASGRGPSGRIEEHGLHLWMGWYENAFRIMRESYAELARDPKTCPISDWTQAFVPAPLIGVADQISKDEWEIWEGALPAAEGLPGDPLPPGQRFGLSEYLTHTVNLLQTLLLTLQRDDDQGWPGFSALGTSPTPTNLIDVMKRFLGYGELVGLGAIVQGTHVLEMILGSIGSYPENLVLRFLDSLAENARATIESRVTPSQRRVWQVLDCVLATLRGEIVDGVMRDGRGFDVIDQYDCREWLMRHGASADSVNCGFLRALYDLGFSYEDGDARQPRLSAAQALRSTMRAFFTYRGAFFFRMQAGMGDIVFAPMYEVMKRRGVRFEFFHRLENVRVGDDGHRHVVGLDFDVQAETKSGGEYEPLVDVQGLPCWPSKPAFEQLQDGERLEAEGWQFESFWDRRRVRTKSLEVGKDFDTVVLGVGVGAIPHVCRDILDVDPRFRKMVDQVKTVATQAFQVWMKPEMSELGWSGEPINVSGFVEPFDTWADMRHLLEREEWGGDVRSLAYFCNVLPDLPEGQDRHNAAYPASQRAQVRRNAVRFLNEDIARLWPGAARSPEEFRWEVLAQPDGIDRTGPDAFDSQFWTANVSPSDRYALTLPGSSKYRISPLDRTYDNLTLTGDWTACGFNAGCVEAAVISGRLAARAVTGTLPELEDIIGYDHP